MKINFKKYLVNIFILFLMGCGMNTNEEEKFIDNLPSLEVSSTKIDTNSRFKNYGSDITAIKSQNNVLLFGYYKANTKTSDGKSRWYISQTFGSLKNFIFSLMPIENNLAGWGEVSKSAATLDIFNNKVTIGNIEDNFSFDYKDWGLREDKHNPIIQKDIEMIRNSTVDIEWWFFKASNGSWYIVNDSSIYKFASKNGLYDWKKIDLDGLEIQFFVDNGVKKMKLTTTSTNENLIGIDVSNHNGSINWEAVKNDGVSIAFIKATEGYPETSDDWSHEYSKNFLDRKFESNMDKAIAEGIVVAPYHFIRVDYNEKTSDAVEEARYFVSKIKPYYENNKLLPPVIDIENPPADKENPSNKNQIGRWSKLEFTNWIRSFAYEVENLLGVKPILYMNESFSNSEVESELFDNYELWIAKYMFSSKNGTVVNSLDDLETYDSNFKPNRNYLFWQFTETAVDIDGVNNFVDKNIFKGTLDDLKKYLVDIQTNARLTRMSPSGTPVKKSDRTLTLYGENLINVEKVFIAGVDITGFTVYNESSIKIETTQRHGGNLAYGVPFGYRDVIVKFTDGSQVVLKNYFHVIEDDVSIGKYPETVLQNKNSDSPYAKEVNAFYATSHGQNLLGQCTWYVYGRLVELVDQKLLSSKVNEKIKNAFWNKYGRDAKNWSALLGISNQGFSTNSNVLPIEKRKKGLLAVWECGTNGHVGFVEEVGGDNKEWYILSDFNRNLHTNYKKQKYKFDSNADVEGALNDRVGGCYPTFYNLDDNVW